jgi:hypothetical protein
MLNAKKTISIFVIIMMSVFAVGAVMASSAPPFYASDTGFAGRF